MPYKVVATFRNNDMQPFLLPTLIYNFAMRYNEAQVLIEINDIGQEIVDLLWNDLEYENIITTTVRGRKGQVMDAGFSSTIGSMVFA